MNYVGVDLHEKIITACVLDANRKILREAKLDPEGPHRIVEFLEALGEYRVVREATASYYRFVALPGPTAAEVVLANPAKPRVIAESTKEADELDARALAESLARDMVPRASLPTPRRRQHRALVRHRKYLRERATAVRCKIRHIPAGSDAERRDLSSAELGRTYLRGLKLNEVDRYRLADLWKEWESIEARLKKTAAKIEAFAKKAPRAEAEAGELIGTAPGVGAATAEAVPCELGDVRRLRNAGAICAYAGLVPVVRQTGGKKARDGGIAKRGSGLLRWALVEAAWRLVASVPRWTSTYGRIKKRSGAKRAIVAVARKFPCVLYAMLRDSKPYQPLAAGPRTPDPGPRTEDHPPLRRARTTTKEPPVERRRAGVTTTGRPRNGPRRRPFETTVERLNGGVPWIPVRWRRRRSRRSRIDG